MRLGLLKLKGPRRASVCLLQAASSIVIAIASFPFLGRSAYQVQPCAAVLVQCSSWLTPPGSALGNTCISGTDRSGHDLERRDLTLPL